MAPIPVYTAQLVQLLETLTPPLPFLEEYAFFA